MTAAAKIYEGRKAYTWSETGDFEQHWFREQKKAEETGIRTGSVGVRHAAMTKRRSDVSSTFASRRVSSEDDQRPT